MNDEQQVTVMCETFFLLSPYIRFHLLTVFFAHCNCFKKPIQHCIQILLSCYNQFFKLRASTILELNKINASGQFTYVYFLLIGSSFFA